MPGSFSHSRSLPLGAAAPPAPIQATGHRYEPGTGGGECTPAPCRHDRLMHTAEQSAGPACTTTGHRLPGRARRPWPHPHLARREHLAGPRPQTSSGRGRLPLSFPSPMRHPVPGLWLQRSVKSNSASHPGTRPPPALLTACGHSSQGRPPRAFPYLPLVSKGNKWPLLLSFSAEY